MPATRTGFWKKKLTGNRARDDRAVEALRGAGWRVIVVWECALRGPMRKQFEAICLRIRRFLSTRKPEVLVISGGSPKGR
jgi:DNA mismatch endonuclease (patch repair protein)